MLTGDNGLNFWHRPFNNTKSDWRRVGRITLIPSNWTREEKEMIDERIFVSEKIGKWVWIPFERKQLEHWFSERVEKRSWTGTRTGTRTRSWTRLVRKVFEQGLEVVSKQDWNKAQHGVGSSSWSAVSDSKTIFEGWVLRCCWNVGFIQRIHQKNVGMDSFNEK